MKTNNINVTNSFIYATAMCATITLLCDLHPIFIDRNQNTWDILFYSLFSGHYMEDI